jgi:hypothetical protein
MGQSLASIDVAIYSAKMESWRILKKTVLMKFHDVQSAVTCNPRGLAFPSSRRPGPGAPSLTLGS